MVNNIAKIKKISPIVLKKTNSKNILGNEFLRLGLQYNPKKRRNIAKKVNKVLAFPQKEALTTIPLSEANNLTPVTKNSRITIIIKMTGKTSKGMTNSGGIDGFDEMVRKLPR